MFADCFADSLCPNGPRGKTFPYKSAREKGLGRREGARRRHSELRRAASDWVARGARAKGVDHVRPPFLKLFLKKGENVGIFRDAEPRCVIYLVAQAF
jgi:hypothetical protein